MMTTLKQRIVKLEKMVEPDFPVGIVTFDGRITPEQQKQIDEAEANGREVNIINLVTYDGRRVT